MLEEEFGKKLDITYADWRPSDQKTYISDIRSLDYKLDWEPTVSPRDGLIATAAWVKDNLHIF
jgi:CDP-paratose 2-epimerase